MDSVKAWKDLKKKAQRIDCYYMSDHSLDDWDKYYFSKIKPLEKLATQILMDGAGIEINKKNYRIISDLMANDNFHSPAETLTFSPVSFCGGCRVGSNPEDNFDTYLEEIEIIKENYFKD